jgi:heterodisulfide reductase subunit C
MQTVRRHGRIHEIEFMTRYFTAMKNPLTSLRFAPLGIKLLRKGKIALGGGKSTDRPLGALFDKVSSMDQSAAIASHAKESHR